MRRTLWIVAGLALAAVLAIGIVQAGGDDEPAATTTSFDLSRALQRLDGAPPPLAALHEEANRISASTTSDYERRIKQLRGYPVVVNAWASWCGPCKLEFPIFQRVATDLGKRVAFVGLNVSDNLEEANDYLAKAPLPYPSLEDGDSRIIQAAGGAGGLPTTIFYDARGERAHIHQGPYTSEADLREAIRRYVGA